MAVGENSLSEVGRFERDGWSEVLFKDINLDSESKVLILGGYKGASAHEYRKRFDCKVLALEPVQTFYEILNQRFANDQKVTIQNLALAANSGQIKISINADSTGFYEKNEDAELETITCIGVNDFFTPPVGTFELMEINIEGAEYEVLSTLLQLNLQLKIRTFLIQFHKNIPDYEANREKIVKVLEKSHKRMFCYDFVWERWDIKS